MRPSLDLTLGYLIEKIQLLLLLKNAIKMALEKYICSRDIPKYFFYYFKIIYNCKVINYSCS